jgi:hypothetical protein
VSEIVVMLDARRCCWDNILETVVTIPGRRGRLSTSFLQYLDDILGNNRKR